MTFCKRESKTFKNGLPYSTILIPIPKIFRRKDITLTRNRVIRICIQNTLVPPIAGYF